MKITKYLFSIFIIIGLGVSLFPISVSGVPSDIDFVFNKDVLFETDNPISNQSHNFRNSGNYNGNYLATYSFENDTNGATANGWVKVGDETSSVFVGIEGHNKTYRGIDLSGSDFVQETQSFTQQDYGTVEVWMRTSDANKFFQFRLHHDADINFVVGMDADIWKYYDGAWKVVGLGALDDTWYHIRLDFETTVGGYMGLSQWYVRFSINGIDYGNSTFAVNSKPNTVWMYTSTGDQTYNVYWDAVGYSWDTNYSLGLNNKPNFEIDGKQEVDKYEFAYTDINELIDVGVADPIFGWDVINQNDGLGQVGYHPTEVLTNRIIELTLDGVNDETGLNGNFTKEGSLIEVIYGFEITSILLNPITLEFYMNSLDDTIVFRFGVGLATYPYSLFWFDGVDYHSLGNILLRNVFYDFNFTVDYNSDTVSFSYSADGVHIADYIMPLIEVDKSGIGHTKVLFDSLAGASACFIDYIGVYINGIPQRLSEWFIDNAELLGWTAIDLETNNNSFDVRHYNLLTITMDGSVSINMDGKDYDQDPQEVFGNMVVLTGYNGTEFFNIYDKDFFSTSEARIVLYIVGSGFNVSYIHLEGVKLTEGVNSYVLIYEYSGVNISKSYFYVDSSHRLQFNLYSNESELEYIQASFNINDVSTNNTAIGWTSLKNNVAFGFFRIEYQTTSNIFELSSHLDTKRVLLENGYIIKSFIILITDNAIPSIEGLTTGYIQNIGLFGVDSIISFTTQSLIFIIVPLILIMFPTIVISERYGKQLIIPLFIMFSLICAITELIPYWLFFITGISSSLFIFFKKKRDDV